MDTRIQERIRADLAYQATRTSMVPGYSPLPKIPTGRYTRQELYDLEMESIFGKSWVCAGREEDTKKPGDYRVFGKLGPSILIVRGKDDNVRAFYNSCQHRGARVVKEDCGHGSLLSCQFHSWTYDLEGKLVAVPDDERDFGKIDKATHGLVQLACDTWGGWIFINRDRHARPLREELAPVAAELDFIKMERLRVVLRYSNRVACNWKAASEAFQEAYHTPTVHKQLGPAVNTRSHSVGLLKNGHSRMFTGFREDGGRALALQADSDPKIGTLSELFLQNSCSYLLFPNIATAMRASGVIFIIFWPRGLRETEIEAIGIGPDWGEGERPPYWDGYNKAYFQLLNEDCENLASMQNSVESGALTGLTLGFPERRIYWTNQEIDKRIGLSRMPPDLAIKHVLSEDPVPPQYAAK